MKPYTALYLDFFGYDTSDFIPCEVCGARAVDINHIKSRGMGGSKNKDVIGNLMALCRADHIKYGDIVEYRPFLQEIHDNKVNERNKYGTIRRS